jgi:hypothetical protein
MRMKIAVTVGIVLAVAAGAYAQSGWMQNSPTRPMMAPADVVCYSVEPWFELASITARPDVLATFVRRDADNRLTQLCFMRVPGTTPDWVEMAAPRLSTKPAF